MNQIEMVAETWAPAFQGFLEALAEMARALYRAAQAFVAALHDPRVEALVADLMREEEPEPQASKLEWAAEYRARPARVEPIVEDQHGEEFEPWTPVWRGG